MSRLVMLSDETGLRVYAGVAGVAPRWRSAPGLVPLHRIDYSACKTPLGGQILSKHGISLHSGGLSQRCNWFLLAVSEAVRAWEQASAMSSHRLGPNLVAARRRTFRDPNKNG